MFNITAVGKSLPKSLVLLMIFNLVSCGGTGSSSGTNTSPVTSFYTITAEAGSNGSVTPSGVTNVAQGVSQSYTITPSPGYAVANLTVDYKTVATSTTYTFANVRGNHTISATFSAAQAGGISLSLVPARTSGVAPLAVFFDASGTTDVGVTTRPFHDLEYTWDFGDPVVGTTGTWAYGAQPGVSSKNSATGPVAAHVFEKSGTYTVSVTAFDGTNTVTTSKTITVDDPELVFAGTKTACVSTSGTFTGCPVGASQVTTSSFTTAMANISGTVKRVLFRAGETWTTTAGVQISQAGSGYIGSFGTGTKPVIRYGSGSNYSIIDFSSDDWRAMDLAIDGGGLVNGVSAFWNGGRAQITLLRNDVTNSNGAFDTDNGSAMSGGTNSDQYTIQNCTSNGINGTSGTVNAWIFGTRLAFQGNFLDNQATVDGGGNPLWGGEHVLRFPKVIKGVIANNSLQNPGKAKALLKLHSSNLLSSQAVWDGTYTEKVVISDNVFVGSSIGAWPLAIASQNSSYDERLRDIITERNYFTGPQSGLMMEENTSAITVRNNIFNMDSTSVYPDAMAVGGNLVTSPNDWMNFYNNTIYTASASSQIYSLYISSSGLVITMKNNLLVTPNNTARMSTGTAASITQSNNFLSRTPSAVFVNGSPTVSADYALKSGSPAIGAGTPIPVWDDFVRATRSADWDVGAYKF
jgi:hypothetical protein